MVTWYFTNGCILDIALLGSETHKCMENMGEMELMHPFSIHHHTIAGASAPLLC